MKKNWAKKDLSKLTKETNKNSIFSFEKDQEKKDNSISFSSEDIEDKMNRLIQLKKLENKNLIQNTSSEAKNKIESSIIKDKKDKNNSDIKKIKNDLEDKKIEEKIIPIPIRLNEEEENKKEPNKIISEFLQNSKKNFMKLILEQNQLKKKGIKFQIEKATILLNFIVNNNIKYKQLIFFENLKEIVDISRKGLKQRTTKKKKTQKMLVKKNLVKEALKIEKEEDEKIEEIEEYSLDEDEFDEDTFIKLNNDKTFDEKANQSQLDEYDLFYKEQFFRHELFRYDADNIQDKEEEDINKQMTKLETKRRLTEKKKLKEVNDLKGLDTTDLNEEIQELTKKYEKIKKAEEPKVELELNNTEKLLQKGRILGFYFKEDQRKDFPHFSMYNFKEKGAEEIIDFKILRKEEQARRFFDYYCCFEQRKKINAILVYLRYYCRLLVDNPLFDYLSLLVIISNTVVILASDPTNNNNIGNQSDPYFLYFYTIECILKIIAFRFWSSEDAYLKDTWNLLDFFVVVVGWILFIIERALHGTKISGLAGLRAFRILRPLKTVKRFKGLKKLVTALLLSLGHLGETGTVLFFFFLIFAIAGRQMWQGLFYRRCTNLNYGYLY